MYLNKQTKIRKLWNKIHFSNNCDLSIKILINKLLVQCAALLQCIVQRISNDFNFNEIMESDIDGLW